MEHLAEAQKVEGSNPPEMDQPEGILSDQLPSLAPSVETASTTGDITQGSLEVEADPGKRQ